MYLQVTFNLPLDLFESYLETFHSSKNMHKESEVERGKSRILKYAETAFNNYWEFALKVAVISFIIICKYIIFIIHSEIRSSTFRCVLP